LDNSNAREDAVEISKFRELFLAELQELFDAELQLSDVLLRMAGAASDPSLKRALIHHRAETETQAARLETILLKHGADPAAHVDEAM
jgi:ferritin-like metal-binding protein YciE